MEIKFKVGDIVKCISCVNFPLRNGKYFKVKEISENFTKPILYVISIDKRIPCEKANLYAYKFIKDDQEYIILKLKGVVE